MNCQTICRSVLSLLLALILGAGPAADEQSGVQLSPRLEPLPDVRPSVEEQGFWTRERKALALNLGFLGGTAAYGVVAWGWGQSSFSFEREGWFERSSGSGGADKLGHAFAGTATTALSAAVYRHWGFADEQAATLGAITGLLFTTAIEIGDGFSPEHGFSWEDQVFNMAGVGLEYLRQRYPAFGERVQFRWEYFPSPSVRRFERTDIFTDYSGSRFLLAFPLGAWTDEAAGWRWLELQVGYGSRGYQSTDKPYFSDTNRDPYIGIGINVTRVLQRLTGGDAGRVFHYIQLPYTAYPEHPQRW